MKPATLGCIGTMLQPPELSAGAYLVLFLKTFVKVSLFSGFYVEKKFNMDVANRFYLHILKELKKDNTEACWTVPHEIDYQFSSLL